MPYYQFEPLQLDPKSIWGIELSTVDAPAPLVNNQLSIFSRGSIWLPSEDQEGFLFDTQSLLKSDDHSWDQQYYAASRLDDDGRPQKAWTFDPPTPNLPSSPSTQISANDGDTNIDVESYDLPGLPVGTIGIEAKDSLLQAFEASHSSDSEESSNRQTELIRSHLSSAFPILQELRTRQRDRVYQDLNDKLFIELDDALGSFSYELSKLEKTLDQVSKKGKINKMAKRSPNVSSFLNLMDNSAIDPANPLWSALDVAHAAAEQLEPRANSGTTKLNVFINVCRVLRDRYTASNFVRTNLGSAFLDKSIDQLREEEKAVLLRERMARYLVREVHDVGDIEVLVQKTSSLILRSQEVTETWSQYKQFEDDEVTSVQIAAELRGKLENFAQSYQDIHQYTSKLELYRLGALGCVAKKIHQEPRVPSFSMNCLTTDLNALTRHCSSQSEGKSGKKGWRVDLDFLGSCSELHHSLYPERAEVVV